MAAEKWRLVVVSHTHWDREWYLPFEQFRIRLVGMVDRLLNILQREPNFHHFTLDGQAIVLEDYLEIRPERRRELERYIGDGRILNGPWYVMPDEFLVDPEALIRNLLRGHRLAGQLGEVMKVGYLPDTFGHIAQMPQILRGFGIDSAVIWRGVGTRAERSEFLWKSPDGSEVLTVYLWQAYDNAAVLPSDPRALIERINFIRRGLEPKATTRFLLLMNGDDHAEAQPDIPEVIAIANARLKDAQLIHGSLPMFIADVRAAGEARGVKWQVIQGEFRSSETAHILAGVLSSRIWIKQRNTAIQDLLVRWAEPFSVFAGYARRSSTADSAYPLIGEGARPFLLKAWNHLLHNHPHDSICGCSVDQVHEEMRIRFDRSEQIAETIVNQSLEAICDEVDTTSLPSPQGYGRNEKLPSYLVVFNPTSGPRTDFVSVYVSPMEGTEDFALANSDGELITHQVIGAQEADVMSYTLGREEMRTYLRMVGGGERWRLRLLERTVKALARGRLANVIVTGVEVRPGSKSGTVEVDIRTTSDGEHDYGAVSRALAQARVLLEQGDVQLFHLRLLRRERVELGFIANNLPAYGYQTYRLLPGHRQAPFAQLSTYGEVVGGEYFIGNEFFSAEIDPSDGSLRMVDKETGALYEGLNCFVDGGDAGDEYTYSPPLEDLVIEKPSAPPRITMLEEGPVRWRAQVDLVMMLPEGLTEDRRSRSNRLVPCPISTRISVCQGIPRIDIETEVDNRASDHVLQVRFPTRIRTPHVDVDGHFAVLSRPLDLPTGTSNWIEQPRGRQPQLRFVDISDGSRGLLIGNRGLPEYEAISTETGTTVLLTLLRCVGWLSRDDLATRQGAAGPIVATPGAQCFGRYVFHYCLVPHRGNWKEAYQQGSWYTSPLRAISTDEHRGVLPASASFVEVQPPTLVVSTVKLPEEKGGAIIRIHNPHDDKLSARLRLFWPIKRAELVNLNEESIREIPVVDGAINIDIQGKQIVTLRAEI